jgi:cell division protein FtsB
MRRNWLQHTLGHNWQPRNQVAALVTLGVIITLIFGGIYLSQVATYAATNRQIESLIQERDRLERRNEELRAEIARFETVPRLLERAEQMGFRPASAADIEYLVIDGYNPDRMPAVVPMIDSEEEFDTAPRYDATFGGWLQQQWDGLRSQFAGFGR